MDMAPDPYFHDPPNVMGSSDEVPFGLFPRESARQDEQEARQQVSEHMQAPAPVRLAVMRGERCSAKLPSHPFHVEPDSRDKRSL